MGTLLSAAGLAVLAAVFAGSAHVAQARPSEPRPGVSTRHDEAAQVLTASSTVLAYTVKHYPVYDVRHGDTLSAISASHCGTTADYPSLAIASHISNPNVIYPGERVTVDCHDRAVVSRPEYKPWHSRRRVTSHARQVAVTLLSSPGGDYSCSGLESLWKSAGGAVSAAFTAAEVAMAESGGNPNAVSPTGDYGLWQVNLAAHGSAMASFNPYTNVRSAIAISADGTNWRPWTTYQTGAYAGRC